MPCDTRWGLILGYFNSILQSEAILSDFLDGSVKMQKAPRRSIFSFVASKTFLMHLKKSVGALRAIVAYQKKFEKNTALPSDVFKAFLSLPDDMNLSSSERSLLNGVIASSFDFVYDDIHGVAYRIGHGHSGCCQRRGLYRQIERRRH